MNFSRMNFSYKWFKNIKMIILRTPCRHTDEGNRSFSRFVDVERCHASTVPCIYVCPLTDKEIPRSVEAYRGMIKCLRWMDKIDVCVVRSSSRFYAAREPPLWRRNGFDIRYSDGRLCICVCVCRSRGKYASRRSGKRRFRSTWQRTTFDVCVCYRCVYIRMRARVPFTFNFREACLCPAFLNRNKG